MESENTIYVSIVVGIDKVNRRDKGNVYLGYGQCWSFGI